MRRKEVRSASHCLNRLVLFSLASTVGCMLVAVHFHIFEAVSGSKASLMGEIMMVKTFTKSCVMYEAHPSCINTQCSECTVTKCTVTTSYDAGHKTWQLRSLHIACVFLEKDNAIISHS